MRVLAICSPSRGPTSQMETKFAHGSGISAIRMLPVSDSVMTRPSPSGVRAQFVVIRPAQDWMRYSGTPCGSMTQTQPWPGLEI